MKYVYSLIFYLSFFIFEIRTCNVMGSRACGQRPTKNDQETDQLNIVSHREFISNVYIRVIVVVKIKKNMKLQWNQ